MHNKKDDEKMISRLIRSKKGAPSDILADVVVYVIFIMVFILLLAFLALSKGCTSSAEQSVTGTNSQDPYVSSLLINILKTPTSTGTIADQLVADHRQGDYTSSKELIYLILKTYDRHYNAWILEIHDAEELKASVDTLSTLDTAPDLNFGDTSDDLNNLEYEVGSAEIYIPLPEMETQDHLRITLTLKCQSIAQCQSMPRYIENEPLE